MLDDDRYDLWKYFDVNHKITMTEGELNDVIDAVQEYLMKKNWKNVTDDPSKAFALCECSDKEKVEMCSLNCQNRKQCPLPIQKP